MKVRDFGEFCLIESLKQIANEAGVGTSSRPDLVVGMGDDAAAWQLDASTQLGTTDMLIENVHFSLGTTSWIDLGWKSLAVNMSDIAAMGGIPTYAMISLGLPPDTEVKKVIELYKGMAEIAKTHDMAIMGGDTSASSVLVISPSVIGYISKDALLRRSNACPGDKIAITGYLGTSAAGLKQLQSNPKSGAELNSILTEAHLRPSPRIFEAQMLVQHGVHSAIDISDGLLADLSHICQASNVGAKIKLSKVPIHSATKTTFPDDAIDLALTGGEDYELLFTAPLETIEKVQSSVSIPITIIGNITQDNPNKVTLLNEDGNETVWSKSGWEHFVNN